MNLKMKFQVESQSSISSSRRKVSVNSPPASLQDWLDEELERRGIDAVIYTRYILSILLQDNYDMDPCDHHNAANEDICSYYFCNDRKLKNCRKSGSRKSSESFICNQHQDGDHEQRKKSAAVECLKSVSDEKYGIEELVEDLCAKLKEFQLENENEIKNLKSQPPLDEVINVSSSIEEQAKKYYAAFPALSDTSTNPVLKLSTNSPEMVIEKSAWTPGHQLLFDCHASPLPNEEKASPVIDPQARNCEDSDPMPNSDSTQNNTKTASFIVPKLHSKISNQARFNSTYVKTEHIFYSNQKSDDKSPGNVTKVRLNNVPEPEVDLSLNDRRVELYCDSSVRQKQSKEDDELLAKFIDKFNGNGISSIWNTMFQPNYDDSMFCGISRWKDTSLIFQPNSESNFLSVWSTSSGSSDSFLRQNWLHRDWLNSNLCFGSNFFDNDYLDPCINPSSVSLLDYCQGLERSSRKISLTLSENGCDDANFISQILHETSDNNENSIDINILTGPEDTDIESLEPDLSSTVFQSTLSLVDDFSLDGAKDQEDCLLTSDKTHFRPIRQDSTDDDVHTAESFSPLHLDQELENLDAEPVEQFSKDPESDSRDSWSPDMKDCFQVSQSWTSYPVYSVASNSSTTDTCLTPGASLPPSSTSESEKEDDDVEDSADKSCSWSPLSYPPPTKISHTLNILRDEVIAKKCETPLTIDVGPWHNENPVWAEPYTSHQDPVGSDYINTPSDCLSWKCDEYYWPKGTPSTSNPEKGYDLPQPDCHEKWSDGLELWPSKGSKETKSCDLVEALRDEIKEETEQLLDDIQDMVSKEEQDRVCDNIDDDALCEWMRNVKIDQVQQNLKTLPQLEPHILDDVLGHAAGPPVSPDDIIFSSELEAEWIKDSQNFYVQFPKLKDKSSVKSHRRPCSFFLEGNCRRSDCKFSHDLSTITCRFWEEGCCFKGITCPFLHGYPLSSEESDQDSNNSADTPPNLDKDIDFPDLMSTTKAVDTPPEESDDKTKNRKLNHKLKKKRRKKISMGQPQQAKNK